VLWPAGGWSVPDEAEVDGSKTPDLARRAFRALRRLTAAEPVAFSAAAAARTSASRRTADKSILPFSGEPATSGSASLQVPGATKAAACELDDRRNEVLDRLEGRARAERATSEIDI
jgi:hypothetical protein